ncbi:hypothetical protein BaRGS_00019823 [Batillaria attramentaria]|uniref:Claudin n=1 Tax=Batillaria attramentaria TaxID=370345 RepID=A0ABD0KNY0_9CAEN
MGLDSGPKHTSLYIGSLIVLVVSLLMFIAGLSAPYWTYGSLDGAADHPYVLYQGLWLVCHGYGNDTDTECSTAVDGSAVWFQAVQGLQLTALILWTFTTGYGGVANCLDPRYSHAIVLVVGTSLSGLLSFIALMIYIPNTVQFTETVVLDLDYQWGFALDLVGTLLGVFAAIGIAISYRKNPFTPRLPRETEMETSYPSSERVYSSNEAVYSSADRGYTSSEGVYPSEPEYPSSEGVYTPGEGAYP